MQALSQTHRQVLLQNKIPSTQMFLLNTKHDALSVHLWPLGQFLKHKALHSHNERK